MEAFCSFDIEADGPCPLTHSMRALGIALYVDVDGRIKLLDHFYVTISPQLDAHGQPWPPDPNTMANFWALQPEAWREVNSHNLTPRMAMYHLATWINTWAQGYTLKWVASPANCDWMWLKCYYEKYKPARSPDLGHYCHDLTSLTRGYCLVKNIRNKRQFIRSLSDDHPYTHHALDDAVCQGKVYMNIRRLLSTNTTNIPSDTSTSRQVKITTEPVCKSGGETSSHTLKKQLD